MLQPRNWGMSLGELDLSLDRTAQGWKVSSKTSRVISVTDQTPADDSILGIGKPYHEAAEKYLERPVADAKVALNAAFARIEDTALIDAIQTVELSEAKAQVSFASAFALDVAVPAGRVTVRQLAALYPYDNTLYRIAGTGKMIREALENAARYFRSCAQDCSQPPANTTSSVITSTWRRESLMRSICAVPKALASSTCAFKVNLWMMENLWILL